MTLAISTSWNAFRFDNGIGVLFEINQLGFKAIELSFNLNAALVESMAQESRRLGIVIQSVHNYCPIPEGLTPAEALPDCYSLSSPDEVQRSLAVKYTKFSIDTAQRLGAKAVVLHCGRVQIPDTTRQLINLYNQGQKDQPDYIKLKTEMIRSRSIQAPVFLKQLFYSLDELNKYAETKKVFLGIETRFYHSEIPDISEIGVILKKFSDTQIYYWHDTGHAQLMENLGFARHKDFLDLYGKSLIGVHLHDILGCQDHRAPLTGDLDFALFKPYFKRDTLKVIEAHSPASPEDLIKSREFITQLYS